MLCKSGQIFLRFCHNARVCQTDRRTDGQTDRILIVRPRLYMECGKIVHKLSFVWNVETGTCLKKSANGGHLKERKMLKILWSEQK